MANQEYPMTDAFPHGEAAGISVKEYIATRALQGILANYSNFGITPFVAAEKAVQFANALLVELHKKANG
jgi:hypothetical protein